MGRLVLMCWVGWLAGCATSFTGSAHIEGGRAGCEAKCTGQGLEMSGIVYLGEYSSACVCSASGGGGHEPVSSAGWDRAAAASAAGAAAGVVMQMAETDGWVVGVN